MNNVNPKLSTIWLDLAKNLKFFNNESSKKIPTKPGLYAWFVPLRMQKDESPYDMLSRLLPLTLYMGPSSAHSSKLKIGWENLRIDLKKSSIHTRPSDKKMELWKRIEKDENKRKLFQQLLMSTSIFMPPLYIGLTKNLAGRYQQHLDGRVEKSSFKKRFTEYSNSLNEDGEKSMSLKDLYFACIEIDIDEDELDSSQLDVESQGEIAEVLEDILKHFGKPIYGEK